MSYNDTCINRTRTYLCIHGMHAPKQNMPRDACNCSCCWRSRLLVATTTLQARPSREVQRESRSTSWHDHRTMMVTSEQHLDIIVHAPGFDTWRRRILLGDPNPTSASLRWVPSPKPPPSHLRFASVTSLVWSPVQFPQMRLTLCHECTRASFGLHMRRVRDVGEMSDQPIMWQTQTRITEQNIGKMEDILAFAIWILQLYTIHMLHTAMQQCYKRPVFWKEIQEIYFTCKQHVSEGVACVLHILH